jgi:16S rRNA (cytidine1402-2'-O)-methyltransferase
VRATAGELAARYAAEPPRGEIVLVVGPLDDADEGVGDEAAAAFRDLVAAGARRRVAASVVARLTGASANDLYNHAIDVDDA